MKKQTQLLLAFLMLISFGTMAQDGEGKITVEITKEINGEKKTFKGTYNSKEEMKADPNYQEFAGDDSGVNVWFGDDFDNMNFDFDQLSNGHGSFFKFFDDDEEADNNSFFFRHFDTDSVGGFFNMNLNGMDMDEYKEKMKELGIELDVLLDKFNDGNHIGASVFVLKRVKVTDVGDEFGKKGKVDESSKLELEDLSFYPNPSSNGRFKVRFTAPSEDELSIKVSNLEGKEVFSRYFESFSGTYSENLDLSGQKEGIYLLEILQGKKRLTKKIVIN